MEVKVESEDQNLQSNHLVRKSRPKSIRFRCGECEKTYSLRVNLLRHQRHEHQETYGTEVCGDCGKRYRNLQLHRNRVHGADTPEHELRERARDDMTLLTVQNFKNQDACLATQYQALHNDAEQILLTLPNVSNNTEMHENISRALRSMLKPSIEHLERILNLEMLRIVTELHKMTN